MAPGAPHLAAGIRSGMTDRARLLDELRPASFAIAYRMLGSVSEAEDIGQEALLASIARSRMGSRSNPLARS